MGSEMCIRDRYVLQFLRRDGKTRHDRGDVLHWDFRMVDRRLEKQRLGFVAILRYWTGSDSSTAVLLQEIRH